MRNIDFEDEESLEKLIKMIESDRDLINKKLTECITNPYNTLEFINWKFNSLVEINVALTVLYRVLERFKSKKSGTKNSFKDFILWHLTNFNYNPTDAQIIELNIWREVYSICDWIKGGE